MQNNKYPSLNLYIETLAWKESVNPIWDLRFLDFLICCHFSEWTEQGAKKRKKSFLFSMTKWDNKKYSKVWKKQEKKQTSKGNFPSSFSQKNIIWISFFFFLFFHQHLSFCIRRLYIHYFLFLSANYMHGDDDDICVARF